jgi:antitoxin PrlF
VAEMLVEKTQITGKGQIQLPARIRQAIGAEVGDEIVFKLQNSGEITVELLKKKKLSELAGILKTEREFPGIEKEEEITRLKVAERAGRYEQE